MSFSINPLELKLKLEREIQNISTDLAEISRSKDQKSVTDKILTLQDRIQDFKTRIQIAKTLENLDPQTLQGLTTIEKTAQDTEEESVKIMQDVIQTTSTSSSQSCAKISDNREETWGLNELLSTPKARTSFFCYMDGYAKPGQHLADLGVIPNNPQLIACLNVFGFDPPGHIQPSGISSRTIWAQATQNHILTHMDQEKTMRVIALGSGRLAQELFTFTTLLTNNKLPAHSTLEISLVDLIYDKKLCPEDTKQLMKNFSTILHIFAKPKNISLNITYFTDLRDCQETNATTLFATRFSRALLKDPQEGNISQEILKHVTPDRCMIFDDFNEKFEFTR